MEDNMADSESSRGSSSSASNPKSVTEQALSAGREIKDKASDLASASADTIKSQASGLMDAAKDVTAQATDKLKDSVSERREAGADYVNSLADTMRRAAREFDTDIPIAGTYMRKAAAQVTNVSDSIRTGEFNDVVRNAQDFARRQPTAFLGLAALAGFAVVRFLKSSSDNSRTPSSDMSGPSSATNHESPGYRNDGPK
jgi:ElaB/YqjD/DUF883 family membrane-anchored ribosome-binding protein